MKKTLFCIASTILALTAAHDASARPDPGCTSTIQAVTTYYGWSCRSTKPNPVMTIWDCTTQNGSHVGFFDGGCSTCGCTRIVALTEQ